MKMNYEELLPFWNKLTEQEKMNVEESCYIETYEKGMMMHRCEDNCKGLMTVLAGQMRTYVVSEEGREVTLFRTYEGENCVLSASCLMDSIAFDVIIEAITTVEVMILPSICLNKIMKSNPYVEVFMYKNATEKFSDVMWTLQQILFQKIDQRVVQFLWDEMTFQKDTTIAMTHEEIAKNIGSAREVVTKVLKYLAKQNIVELKRGKIIILDKDKLKSLT